MVVVVALLAVSERDLVVSLVRVVEVWWCS